MMRKIAWRFYKKLFSLFFLSSPRQNLVIIFILQNIIISISNMDLILAWKIISCFILWREKKKKRNWFLNALYQSYCYFSKCTADTYVQAILIHTRREPIHLVVVWSFWMSFIMSVEVE